MSKELKININPTGEITRADDDRKLADVDPSTGEVKYANPAYAKGTYKEQILKAAESFVDNPPVDEPEAHEDFQNEESDYSDSDPRIPSSAPSSDPSLGDFSAAHINYDHGNMSDKEFSEKYKSSAQCHLSFIAYRPELFADSEVLEERLASLTTA